MKSFNIFLLLLGLLVIITIGFALYKKWNQRETFVNFQNQPATGTAVYIPQYTANPNKTVLSLYDNLYVDPANGTLIEVFAPSCSSGCDTTGQNITEITIAGRDGSELSSIATILDGKGSVKPYSSQLSEITNMSQLYNQFIYTSSCPFTKIYQVIYISWYTDTYIHIIDLSASTLEGTNLKTVHMDYQGIVDSQTVYSVQKLVPYSKLSPTMSLPNNLSILNTVTDPAYSATITILGTDANNNTIGYDIANGNIVLKINGPTGTASPSKTSTPNRGVRHIAYNRNGKSVSISSPTTAWETISTTNTTIINDIPNVSVIVSAYKNETVISILVPTVNKVYKLLYTYRFNKNGYVYNGQTDKDNTGVTPAPTTPGKNLGNDIAETEVKTGDSSVCGDDLSCKWYWYFNTIAQNKNGVSFLSEDYFLKTEAIPPVCPQCPQCPSGGACNSCGGNGGSGTQITTPHSSLPPGGIKGNNGSGTQITTPHSSLPPGGIKGNNGNIYIPYTDSSGNVRYVLYKADDSSSGNITKVDNGEFVTTADPNTIGGGLAVSSLGLGNVGTSVSKDVTGLGSNIVNTAGDVVGGTVNAATGLVGNLAGTASNLVGGTVNAATGLVGGTIGTAADLLKSAGSGLTNRMDKNNQFSIGQQQGAQGQQGQQGAQGAQGQQGQQGAQGVQGNSSLGYTPFGSTTSKTFGNTGKQAPVDNYSHYGALQSKGGNYMPVTADFSAFSK